MQNLVTRFHKKYDLSVSLDDDILLDGDCTSTVIDEQTALIGDEFQELCGAVNDLHELYNVADVSAEVLNKAIKVAHAHLLKELCDVVYTAVGMAVSCGYDFDAAFTKVHISNMTKTKIGNRVMKLEDYVEPILFSEAGYEIN